MRDKNQEGTRAETLTTRRGVIASNLKAIAALAVATTAANLAKVTPAEAGDRGRDSWGGSGRDRWSSYDRDHGRDHDRGHGRDHGGRDHGGRDHGGRDHGGDHDGGGRAPCYLRGTKILTVLGERSIEDLESGDLLPTVFGGARPIQWVGRWQHKKSDRAEAWASHARPVRIVRSALAPDVPHSDLFVTQGHALFIDGVLIPAGALINGRTITLDAATELDQLEYFHIKLATHDVIHAEGAPCETLLHVDETARNFAEYRSRNQAHETRDDYCAPVLYNGRRSEMKSRIRSLLTLQPQKIDLIRARLEDRAMALC